MSRRTRPQPKSALLKVLSQSQVAQSTPTGKDTKKRHVLNVGDLVVMHTPFRHASGPIGFVTEIIDADRVIVRGYGEDDFADMEWLVLTSKPKGTTPDGSPKYYYRFWVKKVLHRGSVAPPPKKPKKPKTPKVIEGRAALLAELASPEPVGASHVLIVPDSEAPSE